MFNLQFYEKAEMRPHQYKDYLQFTGFLGHAYYKEVPRKDESFLLEGIPVMIKHVHHSGLSDSGGNFTCILVAEKMEYDGV